MTSPRCDHVRRVTSPCGLHAAAVNKQTRTVAQRRASCRHTCSCPRPAGAWSSGAATAPARVQRPHERPLDAEQLLLQKHCTRLAVQWQHYGRLGAHERRLEACGRTKRRQQGARGCARARCRTSSIQRRQQLLHGQLARLLQRRRAHRAVQAVRRRGVSRGKARGGQCAAAPTHRAESGSGTAPYTAARCRHGAGSWRVLCAADAHQRGSADAVWPACAARLSRNERHSASREGSCGGRVWSNAASTSAGVLRTTCRRAAQRQRSARSGVQSRATRTSASACDWCSSCSANARSHTLAARLLAACGGSNRRGHNGRHWRAQRSGVSLTRLHERRQRRLRRLLAACAPRVVQQEHRRQPLLRAKQRSVLRTRAPSAKAPPRKHRSAASPAAAARARGTRAAAPRSESSRQTPRRSRPTPGAATAPRAAPPSSSRSATSLSGAPGRSGPGRGASALNPVLHLPCSAAAECLQLTSVVR